MLLDANACKDARVADLELENRKLTCANRDLCSNLAVMQESLAHAEFALHMWSQSSWQQQVFEQVPLVCGDGDGD
eukprot:610886-Karenia_brevis.AAC.1